MGVRAERNLAYLSLGQDDILGDVLSETQVLRRLVRLLSTLLATPVLRASESDRLCLRVIGWLHSEHADTTRYAPVFTDGAPAIRPFTDLAPIYYFPCVEQRGLLYQPLFFHEFGHLLYQLHKPEMDDLVGELQREVTRVLAPPSRRNDRYSERQAAHRQAIADTWYSWAQELYCDAVGFHIGGPCFLRAFSAYLGALNRGDYYREPENLENSAHPVTWLRVRFLAAGATAAGYPELGRGIKGEWATTAAVLGVREDYHGYYDPALAAVIQRVVADMLTEVSPRMHSQSESTGEDWSPEADSPIRLLNHAWSVYDADPEDYAAWEAERIALLLDPSHP